jgi:2,3-dihydroxybenzoate decarboxylase
MDKIALEEHFVIPDFLDYVANAMPRVSKDEYDRVVAMLSDFGEQRLSAMDGAGVRLAVLSMTGSGVQIEQDTQLAIRRARQANDALATEIAHRPDRYAGFAHLAMQDVKAATDELQRCVHELGFKGAMINHQTNGIYLDDPRYEPFWEIMQELDVPLYLYPDNAYEKPHVLRGCPELDKATWEWTTESASHALRLVVSGLFDRYSRLRIILGDMGETVPYMLWRLDSRYALTQTERKLKMPPSSYLKSNFFVTTSGQFSDAPLLCAISALGEDRVMFSIDYPYEDSNVAARFIESASVSETTRAKLRSGNASKLLRLSL